MRPMRKINEIFYSLQGEGFHAGVPSVFIRFSGCNLKCSFCDTSHQEGRDMTDDEICEEVKKFPAKWIVLTGGEPSLWIDDEFIAKLKSNTGKKIAIETNGTRLLPQGIDWVTLSPKFGFDLADDVVGNVMINHADEVKVVYLGQSLDKYKSLPCVSEDTYLSLQPCFTSDLIERERNILITLDKVLENPDWNLSLQMHRFLKIP